MYIVVVAATTAAILCFFPREKTPFELSCTSIATAAQNEENRTTDPRSLTFDLSTFRENK